MRSASYMDKNVHGITNREQWKTELCVGRASGTVLSSRCVGSGVLLASTPNLSVFSHNGMWAVTWVAVMTISEPSRWSWSLASDLAPKRELAM